MELYSLILGEINRFVAPIMVIGLVGTGIFLTLRLKFIQFRRFGHGVAVASGRYDDPDEPGDVSHFQALTTALSATVGIGNIAGVAMAIHIGGPGAVFWMWVTAILGMATKFSEVTLAQKYRDVETSDTAAWQGSVSGGPMYYIERGLGKKWKPLAIFFAFMLMVTSFMTGNAVQANTVATQVSVNFGVDTWITGLVTATLVGFVIIGGIRRIGAVTGVLVPLMAAIYVLGGLLVLVINYDMVLPSFGLIFTEAFRPTAGVAGTGAGLFLMTMVYGVQRGLFSNEAGQGSAPIAHAAAKTDEPVSEGAVAILEPFIDTIIVCTMTALVIVTTGVWEARVPTQIELSNANISYVVGDDEQGYTRITSPSQVEIEEGSIAGGADVARFALFSVPVPQLYLDVDQTEPFTGTIYPTRNVAEDESGRLVTVLYGDAVRNSSPLTSLGFERGLEPIGLGNLGRMIVFISVLLFGISTAISWSYYGDRCANYLWGAKAILPYKMVFVIMHFIGATLAVTTIWDLGDVALSLVTLPNVLALVLLSGTLAKVTHNYFERRPWEENEIKARAVKAQTKQMKSGGQ